jgi:AcrR family transcriptional regulator
MTTTTTTSSAKQRKAPPAPRIRSRHKEATVSAILAAAEEVFAADGVHGAGVTAIARRAGVSVGTLYNHFKDRDELVRALFQQRREAFFTHLDDAIVHNHEFDFRAQLDGFVRAYLDWFDKHRSFCQIALQTESQPVRDPDRRPPMEEILARARRVVAVGVAEKVLRADDVNLYPAILAGIIKGVLVCLLLNEKPYVYPTFRDATETVVRTFLHGAASGVTWSSSTTYGSSRRK